MAPVLVCMDGGVHWQLVGWLCGWKWVGPPGGASSTLDAFRAFPATLLVYAPINIEDITPTQLQCYLSESTWWRILTYTIYRVFALEGCQNKLRFTSSFRNKVIYLKNTTSGVS